MSVDRLANGYQPNFDIDAAVGRQGELLVRDVGQALADGSAEVKTDERAASTGNVYVEFKCLRRGYMEDSGIAATQAEVWAWVLNRQVVVAAPTVVVRQAARAAFKEGRKTHAPRGSHPTQGVLLPVDSLIHRLLAASQAA